MKLNEIADNDGARRRRKRVGRGIGSGTGKTAARGHKGQKSRSGVSLLGFEGGQMPLYRRLPKGGFTNIFRKNYRVVNIGRIQSAIDNGKLDAGKIVTEQTLIEGGVIKSMRDGVRILGKGELKSKIEVVVSGASKGAVDAIEGVGGKITISAHSSRVLEKTDVANAKDKGANSARGTMTDKE